MTKKDNGRKIEKEERERRGVLYVELGDYHRALLDEMVKSDHSNPTALTRWLIEEELKRRGVTPSEIGGAKVARVFGDEPGKRVFALEAKR